MGGGASKNKNSLEPPQAGSIHSRERRMSHVETNPPPQSQVLVECPTCNRSFAQDRIDKHKEVCDNLAVKKREVFDVTEMRIEGTLAADYKDQITEVEKKKNDGEWRKQHEDMINAIREAKKGPRPASAMDPPVQLLE